MTILPAARRALRPSIHRSLVSPTKARFHWQPLLGGLLLFACSTAIFAQEKASAVRPKVAQPEAGVYGRGPLSGLPWFSGQWVYGGPTRLRDFEALRGFKSDSVTQGMTSNDEWFQLAGCDSEAELNAEFAKPVAGFTPSFNGVFKGTAINPWFPKIWGDSPAKEHRERLIHLGWRDVIPKSAGNGNGKNARLWHDVKEGAADKYFFLLGRKFAWLDTKYGDPAYPMTFDIFFEWTLNTHVSWPGGTYQLNGETHETFRDFPYGWSRVVKVFKQGYEYQRGQACPYRFCWRPQLRFSVTDAKGQRVRHERMWPNVAASWVIPDDVKVDGVLVLPKGPIGPQAQLMAISWHDSGAVRVRGGSLTEKDSTWQQVLDGTDEYWGLNQALAFARAQGVPFCFPEWGAIREGTSPERYSTFPGDVYRLTHWLIVNNLDVIAYENIFDQGTGDLKTPWVPAQPPAQDPLTVYRALWSADRR